MLDILSPENYPFDFSLMPTDACLVGGAVRDALLGRKREYLDLDFVVAGDAIALAKKIAKFSQAGFVVLDAERNIARVVFANATVDIAQQEGNSLVTDLQRRDFRINAIAYNPSLQEIIDPLGGREDLQAGILQMVSPANLSDDPLRLLRAYRQAAQLQFAIAPPTQAAIRELAPKIQSIAAERVRAELTYLLTETKGTKWLIQAFEDGLLGFFFPSATNNHYQRLQKIDIQAENISQQWSQIGQELHQSVRDTIKTTWLGVAKLACLVNENPEIAEQELNQLTYSRAEIRGVTTTLKLFPQLKLPMESLREQFFLFQTAGNVFPTTCIVATAHDTLVGEIAPLITRYLNPNDPVAHPIPFLNGGDIILALKIKPSALIGKLLTEVAVAQACGDVTSRDQAVEFVKKLYWQEEIDYTQGGL